MNVRLLGPSATNGRLILLSNFGRENTQISLFDFSKSQAKTLDDGRLQVRMARPVPWRDGFAIIGALAEVIYFVDGQGAFLSQSRLRDFSGWEEDFKIRDVSPGPGDSAFLSLVLRRSGELLLGQLDFGHRKLTLQFNMSPQEPFSQAWVTCGDDLFFYNSDTARIDLVDKVSFQTTKCLNPATEPVKKDKVRPRRKPYLALIEDPIQVQDRVYFRWNQYRDKFGNDLPERRTTTLVLSSRGVGTCDVRPYGSFESRSLVFDWQESEFRLLARDPCEGFLSR